MPRLRLGFDTGLPVQDAQHDFTSARRAQALSRLAARLRGEAGDVDLILPFEEVVEALGRVGERHLGVRTIPLAAIVGTVDRGRDFDREFRPRSARVRGRWERINAAMRRGEELPPIDVLRVGAIYFVRDGHHRVSVARALGLERIDADVTLVRTRLDAEHGLRLRDLPLKSHERVFFERVPLPEDARREIVVGDPWSYAVLAEAVEAWGFRLSQEREAWLSREEVARLWLEDEYRPVLAMLREAGLIGEGESSEAYMRFSAQRYRLARTQRWTPELLERMHRDPPR